jgi:DNA transposition AAA+ family ATPase
MDTTARVQRLATDFMNRTGMSNVDLARRIGYNVSTFQQFMCGRYDKITSSSRIAGALLNFIEHTPAQDENFQGQIYETGAVKIMRGVFARLLDRPQIVMVYAPPGSGKTDVARYLIAQHNAQHQADEKQFIFRVYCRAKISPRDLMKRVATACGTPSDTAIDRAIHNLRWDFKGSRVALYLDEAQHLSIECLETIRELLDEDPRFSLCLAGSHELDKIFTRFTGTLEQLERRITDRVTLPAVTADEAAGILRSELVGLNLDNALIRQQIGLATIDVRVDKTKQRYISIGRLMAACREIRAAAPQQGPEEELHEAIA